MRLAVTALVQVAPEPPPANLAAIDLGTWRSLARYLWAILLARLYEAMPLTCPICSADMRIIAFITEGTTVRRILKHIAEPTDPPRISPARLLGCAFPAPLEAQGGLLPARWRLLARGSPTRLVGGRRGRATDRLTRLFAVRPPGPTRV